MSILGCCRRAGPRRLDDHQAGKITDASLQRYRKATLPLAVWLRDQGLEPIGAEQWDDAVVEWKQATKPTKSEFEGVVAGLEFLFPRMKGGLKWSRAVIAGWNVVHVPRHTVPMGSRPCHFLAANLASDG